jgi:hypothetical protein
VSLDLFRRTPSEPGRYEDPKSGTVIVLHAGYLIETRPADPSRPVIFTYCDTAENVKRSLRCYGKRLRPQKAP